MVRFDPMGHDCTSMIKGSVGLLWNYSRETSWNQTGPLFRSTACMKQQATLR
jgi:hypothetical protein